MHYQDIDGHDLGLVKYRGRWVDPDEFCNSCGSKLDSCGCERRGRTTSRRHTCRRLHKSFRYGEVLPGDVYTHKRTRCYVPNQCTWFEHENTVIEKQNPAWEHIDAERSLSAHKWFIHLSVDAGRVVAKTDVIDFNSVEAARASALRLQGHLDRCV